MSLFTTSGSAHRSGSPDELSPARNVGLVPAVLLLLGAAVAVAALVVFEMPLAAIGWGSAGVVVATTMIFFGEVGRRRSVLVGDFIEATYRKLGLTDPSQSSVAARRWSSLFNGYPQQLFLRAAAVVDMSNPDVRGHLVAQANKAFLPPVESEKLRTLTYVVDEPRRRQRQRLATMSVKEMLPGSEDDVRRRIGDVTPRLVGDGGTATVSFTDGEPAKVTMKFVAHPRLTVDTYQHEVARSFSTLLPGKWRGEWNLELDRVTFERRPPMPSKMDNLVDELPTGVASRDLFGTAAVDRYGSAAAEIPFAVDEYGEILRWAPWLNPMFLVTGGTGKGKTVLEHTLLSGIARRGWEVRVLDGKQVEFLGFRGYPNLSVVASWVEEQVAVINGFYDLMMDRYRMIKLGEADEDDFDPVFLLIDEYRTFQEECNDWYQSIRRKGDGLPAKPPVFGKVGGIARLGRTARCHQILGLQRPDAEFLSGEMRDNFSMRAALGRVSAQQSEMMWGNQYTGVALPAKTRGRGFAVNAEGEPVEMLALWTPDPRRARSDADLALLESLQPREVIHPRMQFERIEWDERFDGEFASPSYQRYADAKLIPYEPDVDSEAAKLRDAVDRQIERDLQQQTVAEAEPDMFAGYLPPISVPVADVLPGSLVQLEGSTWGVVVAEPTPDVLDEQCLVLDVLELATGTPDVLSIDAREQVTVRLPEESPDTEGDPS